MRLMGCPKNIDFYNKVQKFINSYTLSFFKNSLHINFSKKITDEKKYMPVKWQHNINPFVTSLSPNKHPYSNEHPP